MPSPSQDVARETIAASLRYLDKFLGLDTHQIADAVLQGLSDAGLSICPTVTQNPRTPPQGQLL